MEKGDEITHFIDIPTHAHHSCAAGMGSWQAAEAFAHYRVGVRTQGSVFYMKWDSSS